MKARIALVAAALALVALVGYRIAGAKKAAAATEVRAADAALVRTTKVVRTDLSESVSLTGTIRPRNEVDVFAKLPGRLESVHANVGDRVRAGELLAVVEHKEIALQAQAAAAQQQAAEATLEVAKAGLAGAQLELDRTAELAKGGAAPQAALDGAKVKHQLASAQVQQAKAQVAIATASAALARQQLANARIEAPIAGAVTRRLANVGAMAGQQMPVFTVQDVATLKLETSVDALTWSRLARGRPVELSVDAFPGVALKGRVDVIAPTLDAVARRAAVEVLVDNADGKLLPNTFARARVGVGQLPQALAIPREAVLDAAGGAVVFRVKDGRVEAVKPALGPADGPLVAVLEGLEEGDEVVVSGLGNLSDGAQVRAAVNVSQAR